MRRLIVFALFLSAASIHAQNAPFVPVAVWYGGGKVRAPMLDPNPAANREAWRADLKQIKATGFNTVRCWIDWASAEPKEGEYHFETAGQLADLAQEQGLRLIVQVYMDSAPDWVGRKYPDSHFINISGEVMPSNAAPGFCVDHPGVREAHMKFFDALARYLKTKPAFYGWDLWSEPHVINWAEANYMRNPEYCFCPYTVARFGAWLQKKYGTLDALNKAWYRRFESWDEVQPNRLTTILSYTDFIDWRFFITEKISEDLHNRYEAVKKVMPDRVATSHSAAPTLYTSPLAYDGNPDDWQATKMVDYWGLSFYPKHTSPVGRDAAGRAAMLDFVRSATGDKGFYVGELQGGFGTVALAVSATVTPSDLRMWMWSSLARGAKAVNVYAWYPMSSGYESGGFGLINLDGTVTERAKWAGNVAKNVTANAALFANAKPLPSEVAIVYNPLSYMVGGRRPQYTTAGQSEIAGIEHRSMLGTWRALFPTNVQVDFVHIDDIAAGQLVGANGPRYKVVFLPYPLMLPAGAGKPLRDFVAAGGTLVTEARPAWNDEQGKARDIIPGYGLNEVCSCRETAVHSTVTGKTEMVMSADFAGLKSGDTLRGSLFEETLEPAGPGAKVLAKFADGTAAMVSSDFGKGKMLAIGTFLGTRYEMDRDENIAKLLRGVLDWSGVKGRVTTSAPLELKMLRSGASTLVFAFNHASDSVESTIAIDGLTGKARDVETGSAVEFPLKHRFTPNDVWVLEVK